MAAAKITLTKIPQNGGVAFPAMVALNAADGALIDFTEQDAKTVILIQNTASAAADVTIKMGTGIQGVADLVENIGAGDTKAFALESGAFKIMSGPDAGHIKVTGAATIKVGALVLP